MKEKRNIRELIIREEPHLNNMLDADQVKQFKGLTEELRDTWTKNQMFRTKTEMEFSVLNDARYPTNGAKYWQCVREQNSHMQSLLGLSFEYRKNEIETKQKLKELEEEKDELKKELIQVEIDRRTFHKANFQLEASHRMREISEWSRFKKSYNDGSFDSKNVDAHQLLSYKKTMRNRHRSLTPGSSQAEVFNVIGQLETIERLEKEQKILRHKKKKTIGKK
jgi:hypothetical protein|tara:strand:- start:1408 stop:2073 length:666 start_codon:yes stop_codon:yes gene_type:complete